MFWYHLIPSHYTGGSYRLPLTLCRQYWRFPKKCSCWAWRSSPSAPSRICATPMEWAAGRESRDMISLRLKCDCDITPQILFAARRCVYIAMCELLRRQHVARLSSLASPVRIIVISCIRIRITISNSSMMAPPLSVHLSHWSATVGACDLVPPHSLRVWFRISRIVARQEVICGGGVT